MHEYLITLNLYETIQHKISPQWKLTQIEGPRGPRLKKSNCNYYQLFVMAPRRDRRIVFFFARGTGVMPGLAIRNGLGQFRFDLLRQ
mmetsp:Transcript_37834/g.74058  ORF Transcript_37834/g.74058 Transcript_37834/m.74058 type:complete len:87 (-) Transcript_37834:184-444(-)